MLDDMLGVVGWATMLLAAAVLVRRPLARELDITAALAVWPLLVLWNPLAIAALSRLLPGETFHRLLYGSVFWLLPVVTLKHLVDRMRDTGQADAGALFARVAVATTLVLAALSFSSDPPLHGRLHHVWDRVDPRLDGGNLGPLVRFVRHHAARECVDPLPDPQVRPIRRYVLSDPYVGSYLVPVLLPPLPRVDPTPSGRFRARVPGWPDRRLPPAVRRLQRSPADPSGPAGRGILAWLACRPPRPRSPR
jgi:hypothetical protein